MIDFLFHKKKHLNKLILCFFVVYNIITLLFNQLGLAIEYGKSEVFIFQDLMEISTSILLALVY